MYSQQIEDALSLIPSSHWRCVALNHEQTKIKILN